MNGSFSISIHYFLTTLYFKIYDNYLWVSIDTHIISILIASSPHVPVQGWVLELDSNTCDWSTEVLFKYVKKWSPCSVMVLARSSSRLKTDCDRFKALPSWCSVNFFFLMSPVGAPCPGLEIKLFLDQFRRNECSLLVNFA